MELKGHFAADGWRPGSYDHGLCDGQVGRQIEGGTKVHRQIRVALEGYQSF